MNGKMKQLTSMSLLAAVLIAGLILWVGCKKSEPAAPAQAPTMEEMHKHAEEMKETATETAAEIEQTMCPIMDGNKIDKNVFVEYKGKKVYFCCPACKPKFEADPEKYIPKLPQFKN